MQCRRRADIDDVNLGVIEQVAVITICLANVVFLGEVKDMIAPRGNGCHLGVNAVDAIVSIHMQFSDKATSDKTDHHLWHRDTLPSSEAHHNWRVYGQERANPNCDISAHFRCGCSTALLVAARL